MSKEIKDKFPDIVILPNGEMYGAFIDLGEMQPCVLSTINFENFKEKENYDKNIKAFIRDN